MFYVQSHAARRRKMQDGIAHQSSHMLHGSSLPPNSAIPAYTPGGMPSPHCLVPPQQAPRTHAGLETFVAPGSARFFTHLPRPLALRLAGLPRRLGDAGRALLGTGIFTTSSLYVLAGTLAMW